MHFKCKKGILTPILEAVTNSIQANATDIYIYIYIDKTLYSEQIDNETEFQITSLEIIDNGDGFTKENIKRFNTIKERLSEEKNKKNCKGMGRLSYLKYFDSVKYESITKENNKVNFVFDFNFGDKTEIISTNLQGKNQPKTTALFSTDKKSVDKKETTTLNKIRQAILDELMITLFLYNKDKKENENIKINLCFGHKKNNASNKVKYLISDKNDIPSFGKIEFNLTDDCPSKTKKTTNIHTLL